VIWEKKFYPLGSYWKNIQCAVDNEVVVTVGGLKGEEYPKIYAFNGKTGEILWTYSKAPIIVMTQHGLFAGDDNKISLIRSIDGKIIWEIKLNNVSVIRKMMYKEEKLFVNTDGFYQYFVVDINGNVISEYKQESDFHNEHEEANFTPTLPFGNINAGEAYVRHFGDVLYSAAVYEKSADSPLWKSNTYSISNFLLYGNYVVWISPDDKIIKADKNNGQILDEIKITPSIYFFDNNSDKQHAGYYLCGNEEEKMVYLLLGNSRQLFAISTLE
jgi:outer membrane protein assembly factor BamB